MPEHSRPHMPHVTTNIRTESLEASNSPQLFDIKKNMLRRIVERFARVGEVVQLNATPLVKISVGTYRPYPAISNYLHSITFLPHTQEPDVQFWHILPGQWEHIATPLEQETLLSRFLLDIPEKYLLESELSAKLDFLKRLEKPQLGKWLNLFDFCVAAGLPASPLAAKAYYGHSEFSENMGLTNENYYLEFFDDGSIKIKNKTAQDANMYYTEVQDLREQVHILQRFCNYFPDVKEKVRNVLTSAGSHGVLGEIIR